MWALIWSSLFLFFFSFLVVVDKGKGCPASLTTDCFWAHEISASSTHWISRAFAWGSGPRKRGWLRTHNLRFLSSWSCPTLLPLEIGPVQIAPPTYLLLRLFHVCTFLTYGVPTLVPCRIFNPRLSYYANFPLDHRSFFLLTNFHPIPGVSLHTGTGIPFGENPPFLLCFS